MTFKKGKSGNPAGRPRGSADRRAMFRRMIEPHSEELVNTAVNMALDGNEQMLRLILDRVLPAKPKDGPVSGLELTGNNPGQDAIEITQCLAAGELTPIEANNVMSLVLNNMRLIGHVELVNRLEALEENYEQALENAQ